MNSKTVKPIPNYTANGQGSIWHRWEPHIHAPGTILNDQYTGSDPLEDFLQRIEKSIPSIRALGVTDYLSLDLYEKVLDQKKSKGRLVDIELLFPNVEIRFSIATAGGSAINAHLLVSPDDPEHVEKTRHLLSLLNYKVLGQTYQCRKEDLIRLGKAHDTSIKDDRKALEVGTNQFKVNFDQLKEVLLQNEWAQKNILIAVSGNTNDGTAGLKDDASFASLRNELQRNSHIIFSSHEKQRLYWLGKGADSKDKIIQKYRSLKPIMHGSDAHTNGKVGKPDLDRYTWIKGDLTFESLRQACIEPEERVIIGSEFPNIHLSSRTIQSIEAKNAPWLVTPLVPINPGLVAIIGARGSGKTALADLISVGGYAAQSQLNPGSFLKRAEEYLKDEAVTLTWLTGETATNEIKHIQIEDLMDEPRVQYLSQQFVEELCSSEGPTDRLMSEMERVVFQAHPVEERSGTNTFRELLDLKSQKSHLAREMHEESLTDISADTIIQMEKRDDLARLQKLEQDRTALLENDKKARQLLVGKGQEEREKQHKTVSDAVDTVRKKLDDANKKYLSLETLQQAVDGLKTNTLPNHFKKLQETHGAAGLTPSQWDNFKLEFKGDVSKLLTQEIAEAKKLVEKLKGKAVAVALGSTASLIPDGQKLEDQDFGRLSAELSRIQSLIGIDKENSKKYTQLSDKISKEEGNIRNIKADIVTSQQASVKLKELRSNREKAYKGVFQAIIEEEQELNALYNPLMQNLKTYEGAIKKLTFHVVRSVDIEMWAARGEELIDLRIAGGFKGKGSILEAAKSTLQKAWETGTADEVSKAMAKFREENDATIVQQASVDKNNKPAYRAWLKEVGEWLYSTDHISVSYGIKYDNVNIKQLSPGTRGIVLLMLYLAIDREDDRPLIIDQPEENLDPKSIFDELVPTFRNARKRRQIIIITHNANLVVNTDVDQVIVASSSGYRNNELPLIKYDSGGLENAEIRKMVCEILEGGEAAFVERAKRLRVAW